MAILLATAAGTLHAVILAPASLAGIVTPVADSPAVQAAVAEKAAATIVVELDVEGRVQRALPGVAGALAAPSIAGAVQDRIASAIEDALASPALGQRWNQVALAAATEAVDVLRGDSAAVTTSRGELYLNLLPTIGGALDALKAQGILDPALQIPDLSDPSTPARQAIARLGAALGVSLPADFGQVAIARTAALEQAQGVVSFLDAAWLGLALAAFALTLAAVAAAVDRRAALVWVGLSAGLLLAIVPPLLRLADPIVTGAIASPGMAPVTSAFVEAVSAAVSWPVRGVAAASLLAALGAIAAGARSGGGVARAASLLPLVAGGVALAVAGMLAGPDGALLALGLVTTGARLAGRRLLARAPA